MRFLSTVTLRVAVVGGGIKMVRGKFDGRRQKKDLSAWKLGSMRRQVVRGKGVKRVFLP
jgi:hypothetical protein